MVQQLTLLLLFALPGWGQEPVKQPETAKQPEAAKAPETLKQVLPADRQAFIDAQKVRNPEERISVLEKSLRDFPESRYLKEAAGRLLRSTRATIFQKLLKDNPSGETLIRAKAEEFLAVYSGLDRARMGTLLARSLVEAKLYPKLALRYAKTSLATLSADLDAQDEVAEARSTLGQCYALAGKTKAAEKQLRQALQTKPELSTAAIALADLLEMDGKAAPALRYLGHASLVRPSVELSRRFDAAYGRLHPNAPNGGEAYLDALYHELYPPAEKPPAYRKPPQRSERAVLAEVHTGSGCPPCVAADLAFDNMLEVFSRQDLIVVMYHQHIPRPDPMTNDASAALWAERKGRGVPSYWIDGTSKIGGGSRADVSGMTASLRKQIEERLTVKPGARLILETAKERQNLRVDVEVGDLAPGQPTPKLRLALVEKLLRYSGENGVRFHPMVARSLATLPASPGRLAHTFDLAAVRKELQDHLDSFELKNERHNPDGKFRFRQRADALDEAQLAVVAYLEDEKGSVLQAAYAEFR